PCTLFSTKSGASPPASSAAPYAALATSAAQAAVTSHLTGIAAMSVRSNVVDRAPSAALPSSSSAAKRCRRPTIATPTGAASLRQPYVAVMRGGYEPGLNPLRSGDSQRPEQSTFRASARGTAFCGVVALHKQVGAAANCRHRATG